MYRKQREHMVKKTAAAVYIGNAAAVKFKRKRNVGFVGFSVIFSTSHKLNLFLNKNLFEPVKKYIHLLVRADCDT